MDLITFVDKLTPVLVVIIPSYFSYKSNRSSKETDKRIEALSEDFVELKESVANVQRIGDKNNDDLNLIQKGLQRLQRFRLQENLKKALRRGYTTQHELEELSRLYESYVELGGNGAIKILFEKFSKLDTKEEK
ncbi:TPA: hypothetical protein VCY54_001521 [Streptococcus pyogenes]|uniref:hypothetical protein n=1 Tax=Streptococcus gordonii TaxID=1302 RepID=UPI001CBD571C|nr:hypothetical protein [Streptococcus gordonii]HEP3426261.1 hypothetical protein [Streptococcus pyogenes]MBZ2139698.1 hypothetical protein [Streptococcus gordonii]MBZ2139796.1 hypothetical protein [Streptococcus gordonii]HEP4099186.1 hypothetical protein [Streptococcus pyogenes]HEP5142775.1 hypothetical protein [Streptococcus pyogenes]